MRIRKIISALVLAASLCSCGQKGYTIKGDIIDLDEGDINLLDIQGRVMSTTQVVDGKFTFTGKVDVPCLVYINNVLGVKYPIDIPLLLENTTIKVTGDARISHIDITGTKANEHMVQFKKRKDQLHPDDDEGYLRLVRETFEENRDNILGAMLISNFYGRISDKELLEYCDRLPSEFMDNVYVQHYRKVARARVDTEVGAKFKDFDMIGADSVKVSLSDVVKAHKATVVLFWASWARDASTVITEITEGCGRYRADGLEMFNVSLDSDMAKLAACEKDFGIFGLSFSNGPEAGDKASSLYGFEGLPRVVLIDKEGTIVARGRSFESLAPSLKTLFDH